MLHSLTLDKERIRDFTGYLSVDGVRLSFDENTLMNLREAREAARSLAAKGLVVDILIRSGGVETEFLGVSDLYRMEEAEATIDASGLLELRAEVRHGDGEGLSVSLRLDELEDLVSA